MSAYLCNEEHIGKLAFAFAQARVPYERDYHKSAGDWAVILAGANWSSVAYRYGHEAMKQMSGGTSRYQYANAAIKAAKQIDLALTPLDLIRMADCFAYQSCETPEWQSADYMKGVGNWHIAYFKDAQIGKLPGYENAIRDYEGPKGSVAVSLFEMASANLH